MPHRGFSIYGFFFAYCSMGYQLVIMSHIGFLTGDQTKWQSITSGAFLLGLGLGSGLKQAISTRRLVRTEWLLTLLSTLTPVVIFCLHIVYRMYLYDFGLSQHFKITYSFFYNFLPFIFNYI